jgi:hypothetical protein
VAGAVIDVAGAVTDEAGGVTDEAGGVTDEAGGVTDEAGGVTDEAGGVTDGAEAGLRFRDVGPIDRARRERVLARPNAAPKFAAPFRTGRSRLMVHSPANGSSPQLRDIAIYSST